MYKAIDFPSPLLLFLALFRSLSLSCSLFLSLVVVVASGLSPDRGLSAHPRLSSAGKTASWACGLVLPLPSGNFHAPRAKI